jgi:hypothetical protein
MAAPAALSGSRFRSSPEAEFTWNGPKRKREPRGVCTIAPNARAFAPIVSPARQFTAYIKLSHSQ